MSKSVKQFISFVALIAMLIGFVPAFDLPVSATPTMATVATDKAAYAAGEDINFTVTSNGIYNTLWVYRVDGQWQHGYDGVSTTYTLSLAWEGEYKAQVEVWNETGSIYSEPAYFTVGDSDGNTIPTYATIATDKSVYTLGSTVNFTMSSDGYTNTLWIFPPDGLTSVYYENAGASHAFVPTKTGVYEAVVEAWNGVSSFCSERIRFLVTYPNSTTTTLTTTPTTAPTTKPTEPPASAAVNPVLVLGSTTAVNPILDHILSADLFASGGPFTVTFDWKAVGIKYNDASDPNAAHAFVGITGTVYGTLNNQNVSAPSIKGTTDWEKVSFQFQNVGTYPLSGTNMPGNILRFGLWKAKGELHIRNLVIKSANGTVKYRLNTDPVVAQAVANTRAQGLTECALDELAAIDFKNCPWEAGQYSTGNYNSYIYWEDAENGNVTTIPTTKPTTAPTTAPTTTPTTASTTQPSLENLYATLSVDKSTYAVDETVTFTTSSNGTSNTLRIYRVDGQWQTYCQNVGSSYTLPFGWEGEYKALIETWCATGSVCSEYIYFTVGDASSSYAPTYATIGVDKSVYKIGDTVNFSMATDGESNTLWIYKPDGTSEYFQNAGSAYCYIPTMAGQYEALFDAWNSVGNFTSERIKFTVVNPTPTTTPTTAPTTKPTTAPTIPPASAAVNPILVLGSTTAVNPILDHILSADLFASGGPFTVTFDWKAVGIKDNDASNPGAGEAFVGVTGTIYGTLNNQSVSAPSIKGTTDWEKVSFQFQNVGTYPQSGSNYPGNILRFGLWKAKASFIIAMWLSPMPTAL